MIAQSSGSCARGTVSTSRAAGQRSSWLPQTLLDGLFLFTAPVTALSSLGASQSTTSFTKSAITLPQSVPEHPVTGHTYHAAFDYDSLDTSLFRRLLDDVM